MSDVPCPSCSQSLPTGAAACPRCGLNLTGPDAARLWEVDQQLGALQRERAQLLTRLREVRPAGAPDLLVQSAARSGWTGQQVLLGGGVALVLVAAVVFIAVAWPLLGVAGQVAVMIALTVAAAASSVGLAARGLRSTAEAVALLSVGLTVLDTVAARSLDLAGLGSVDGAGYVAGSALLVAAWSALLARHRTQLWVFTVAGLLAAAVVPGATLLALDPAAPAARAAWLLAAGAGFTALARTAPVPWRRAAAVPLVAAGFYLLTGVRLSFVTVRGEDVLGQAAVAALLLAAVVGVLWWWALSQDRPPRDRLPGVVAGAAIAAVTLVLLAGHAGQTGRAVMVVAAVTLVATSLLPARRPGWLLTATTTGHLTAALGVAASGVAVYTDHPFVDTTVLAVLLALVAAAATLTALRTPLPVIRAGSAAYAALAALAAALAVTTGATGTATATTVALTTAVALAAAAVAGRRAGHLEELSLGVAAVLGLVVAALAATSLVSAVPLAAVLAAAGLAALAYALLPERGLASVAGVLGCSGATWVLSGDAGITVVEAYSLPLAALAAVVGVVRLAREPDAPSWATAGPALGAALLPSALATVDDPSLLRPLLVLATAAVVVTLGALVRWQAPLVTGTAALLVVATSQLAPYAIGMPRYLSLGTVGLVLLLLGARYERRRRDARHTVEWVLALR